MTFRSRSLAAAVMAGAVLAGAVLGLVGPPARAAGDAIDDKIKAFEEYLKTKPDSQGLRNQIAELSLSKDPRVADALKPLLRHKDDDVKIAVCQNIGKQGDPAVANLLKAICEMKDIEKDNPKLMAAAIEGIGDANAKGFYDYLLKIAKKQLDYSSDIASAAFRAAANHVTRDTVDDLIKELGRADYVTQQDNPVKKAARNACKPVLINILQKTTGQQINDVKIWNEWWGKEKKTWKPPIPGKDEKKDINAADDYDDSAYGFVIKKPSRAWLFRKPDGNQPYLVLEALDEGQRAAWVELTVVGTKNYVEKTPEGWAAAMKSGFEGKFRDIKEAEWEKKTRVAGESAIEQRVFGQHKDYDAVQMTNVYLSRSEVMYQLICIWKSGKSQALKDDIDEIIKTFRLTR